MSENQYAFKYDEYGNTKEIVVYASGVAVTTLSYVNKGTAFNENERKLLGLQAALPPGIRSLENQVYNSTQIVNGKSDDLEKYIFIRAMFERNVTLAHALISSDLDRLMGIIYTPTVSMAVKKYSSMFRRSSGLHFTPDNIDLAEDILRRYLNQEIRVAVVTDNGGILGIGDQGAGGIAISLGKLMLYTQGAGIAPWHCLPVSLDVGTDNSELLNDPLYLGWRHERLQGEDYLSFIGRFARAFRNVFPNALCQWEDFSSNNAFAIRDSFADELISFNDDIQGTGAITLAAIYSAMKVKSEKLVDQSFLVCVGGIREIGIAEQIEDALVAAGLERDEARRKIFIHDGDGVISSKARHVHYKMKYTKNPEEYEWIEENRDLAGIVEAAHITVMVGACGSAGCFTRSVVEAISRNTEKPVILPISGLEEDTEIFAGDLQKWSSGKALVAHCGSCFGCEIGEVSAAIAPCNNVLVFPGVALGTIASGARQVLPRFFTEAARAISDSVSKEELQSGRLVPTLSRFPIIADHVALAVAMCAVREGVSRQCAYADYKHEDDEIRMKKLINGMRWKPEYLPLTAM
ncbi:MAG: oxaloacetate-decarboxylating malate dehydrogenase [Desulfocapsaceae bacterium]|jgi:malate dehydrogenase (oxaloacetate-decarboxylating)|nr:oxaloacetate-decarboxylating malate dehydrogenase [Desulfocapsaceae bacterium]